MLILLCSRDSLQQLVCFFLHKKNYYVKWFYLSFSIFVDEVVSDWIRTWNPPESDGRPSLNVRRREQQVAVASTDCAKVCYICLTTIRTLIVNYLISYLTLLILLIYNLSESFSRSRCGEGSFENPWSNSVSRNLISFCNWAENWLVYTDNGMLPVMVLLNRIGLWTRRLGSFRWSWLLPGVVGKCLAWKVLLPMQVRTPEGQKFSWLLELILLSVVGSDVILLGTLGCLKVYWIWIMR